LIEIFVRIFIGQGSPLSDRTYEPAMGNSTSTGQGSEMPHGERDNEDFSTDRSNWP